MARNQCIPYTACNEAEDSAEGNGVEKRKIVKDLAIQIWSLSNEKAISINICILSDDIRYTGAILRLYATPTFLVSLK